MRKEIWQIPSRTIRRSLVHPDSFLTPELTIPGNSFTYILFEPCTECISHYPAVFCHFSLLFYDRETVQMERMIVEQGGFSLIIDRIVPNIFLRVPTDRIAGLFGPFQLYRVNVRRKGYQDGEFVSDFKDAVFASFFLQITIPAFEPFVSVVIDCISLADGGGGDKEEEQAEEERVSHGGKFGRKILICCVVSIHTMLQLNDTCNCPPGGGRSFLFFWLDPKEPKHQGLHEFVKKFDHCSGNDFFACTDSLSQAKNHFDQEIDSQ